MAAQLLALQRGAGNRAVASVVQRGGPPPTTGPVAFRPAADINALTLSGFDSYAQEQADWARDPALTKPQKTQFIDLLEFARIGAPAPLGPCGDMKVSDLLATGMKPPERAKLRTYARGQRAEDSAAIPKTAVIADAERDADALTKMEKAIAPAVLHKIMGTKDEGKAQFGALVSGGKVDEFATYAKRAHPALEADNGADVEGFLKMVNIDGKSPTDYVGKLPHVRNYHRFLAPMLDTLIKNEGDTSRARPLMLILHTGSDHNGAFQRDAELMATVQHPRNLAIMVEGAVSLEAVSGDVAAIAARQGQKRRVEQVMIAGHGSMRGMDLAGTPDGAGGFKSDDLDLDKNGKRTEKFLRNLVAHMASGPNARIVLNACLTAADEVKGKLPSKPEDAKKAILDSLADKPSLAGRIGQLGKKAGVTVEGNVSSVPAGTYMSVDAAGNPTGLLHQGIPTDPYATSTNRGDYVEFGVEPEGAIRAVVALWGVDRAECLKRVEARRKKPIAGWGDRVIHTFYDLLAAAPDDIDFINRIANSASRALSEMMHPAEQVSWLFSGLNDDFSAAEESKILTPLYGSAPTGGQLALDAVWMQKEPKRQATFMASLATYGSVQAFAPHLDGGTLAASTAALLPVASASAPSRAQIMLALWGVTGDRYDGNAKAFLKAGAAASLHIAVPVGSTVDGLTGSETESDILEAIGLKGASAPAPTSPKANVDTDGDGVNDTYVESITRQAVVTATWLNVRAAPDIASARLTAVPAGSPLYVFGRSGDWLAVEQPKGVGFVHRKWVRGRPLA